MISSNLTFFQPTVFSQSNLNLYTSGHMFSIPNEKIKAHFLEVDEAISNRWIKHCQDISFPKYYLDKDIAEIKLEFSKFKSIRNSIIANNSIPTRLNTDFDMAESLIANHRYRQPNCITFEHSKTDNTYNSTCLTINARHYFALEGPTQKHVEYFYRLLLSWDVGMLVSLTGEEENGTPKCYPYWNEKTFSSDNEDYIGIPIQDQYDVPMDHWDQKKLPFLHISDWKDHQGYDIKELVESVDHARKRIDKDQIMAIHCSGGVGRTGTFLAIMALFDAIDSQIEEGKSLDELELSIAELYIKLNLHRRPLIAKEAQYIAVYRAVDFYLKNKI
ncbi:MAG: hypothetical protein S4CHLAM7_11910 [Chlamydiae bacterium]|nr:hypothetical protein [Chlamydiota bacterium]